MAPPRPTIATPAAHVGRPSPLRGARELIRLALRRDRLRLTLWFTGIVGMVAVVASSMRSLYDTPAERREYAELVEGNATMIVQSGPGYGLDDPTSGAVLANELGIWVFIAVALMNVFVVVRHTRTEEATNRTELVRAAPVGRAAGTAAALAVSSWSTLLVASGSALSLIALGLPTVGSLAFGAAIIGIGHVFAGVAAVAAQLTENPRSALGLGGAVLALSFVLRAVGDVGDGTLSWLSPIGWAQGTRAYADERWWVLGLAAVSTVALVEVATVLQRHRDHGSGMIASRGGPATGAPWMSTPVGLTFRLQRASIISWSIGAGLVAFFYGIISDQAESILESYPEMEEYFLGSGDASITDLFLSRSITTMALFAAGFSVASVLRLRTEEITERAGSILATPTSRTRWAVEHLVVTAVGTTCVLAAVGAATGLGVAATGGSLGTVAELTGAAVTLAPALFLLGAATFALVGVGPRAALVASGAYSAVVVIGVFGELLSFPRVVLNVSPFEHLRVPPADRVDLIPVGLLLGASAA
ncbi:MAG: hypothetical protein AAFP84_22700, partial [Actinomycetota bacterium]